jgi:hypothetical protein
MMHLGDEFSRLQSWGMPGETSTSTIPFAKSIEEIAKEQWNSETDSYNQWPVLGQDEKDALIEEVWKKFDKLQELENIRSF